MYCSANRTQQQGENLKSRSHSPTANIWIQKPDGKENLSNNPWWTNPESDTYLCEIRQIRMEGEKQCPVQINNSSGSRAPVQTILRHRIRLENNTTQSAQSLPNLINYPNRHHFTDADKAHLHQSSGPEYENEFLSASFTRHLQNE